VLLETLRYITAYKRLTKWKVITKYNIDKTEEPVTFLLKYYNGQGIFSKGRNSTNFKILVFLLSQMSQL
jgi:hypothetical protein